MASNAKFCSQCASPLPEPNPPFCSQCGTSVKPNDVQPSQPIRPSRSNNKPLPDWINSGSKKPNTSQSSYTSIIKDIIVKHPFRAIFAAVVVLPAVLTILTVVILAIPSETDISNTIDDAPKPEGGIISVSSKIDGRKHDTSFVFYDIGYSRNGDDAVTGIAMFKSQSQKILASKSTCIPGDVRIHLNGEVYFLTTGTSVEILDRAYCDVPSGGMVKVRVPENGLEGWTFARNVVPVFKR